MYRSPCLVNYCRHSMFSTLYPRTDVTRSEYRIVNNRELLVRRRGIHNIPVHPRCAVARVAHVLFLGPFSRSSHVRCLSANIIIIILLLLL